MIVTHDRWTTKNKALKIRAIEYHLRNYKTYKAGIKNLERQLEYIMPGCTANYEFIGQGKSGFFISSSTEKYGIDRIESKTALDLYEKKKRYEIIVESIDEAVANLDEVQQEFVKKRYFEQKSFEKMSQEMGYSQRALYDIRQHTMNRLLISLGGILEI